MKILFVNQCYWPDHAATAQILTDLAEELVERGHEVTVVCSRKPYSGADRDYPKDEHRNGVKICRVSSPGWGKRIGLGGRLGDSLLCLLGTFWKCMALPRPDVIVTLTSPPMIGVVGRLLQLCKRTAHVHWCMDMFPDIAIVFGVLRERGWFTRSLAFLTARYLQYADAVLVLSGHMGRRIKRYGVTDAQMEVVPVWADGRKLKPVPVHANRFLHDHHLTGRFVLMYSGNLAHGGDIDTLLEALSAFKNDPNMMFVLISEGPRFEEFRTHCATNGFDNVLFLPYQRRAELGHSLSAADLHVITNKKGVEGVREPCKVYGVLAVGRPFILIGDECVATDLARDYGAGVAVVEGDVTGLIAAIKEIKASETRQMAMRRGAREAFRCECDIMQIIDTFEQTLLAAIGPGARKAEREASDEVCESVDATDRVGAERPCEEQTTANVMG